MLELRCADLGVPCRGTVRGATEEELVRQLAEHAASKHGVARLNETLVAYARTQVRGTPEEREERR